ncbi:MAG: DUF4469 domain-containing protein, partial [Spirochaetaceae bacterium]|nr:DUF4469 domain-containing protein [Spirochaetaceae bacterium]
TDIKSGTLNNKLTPGRDIRISGSKLKIGGDSPEAGLYFVPVADGAPVKVAPSDIVVNHPSELIVLVPPLAAGAYHVKVATQYTSGKPLKTPHTFTFDKSLTVDQSPR